MAEKITTGTAADRLQAAQAGLDGPHDRLRGAGAATGATRRRGKNLKYLGFPNPREWSPTDEDWKLPDELAADHPRRAQGAAGASTARSGSSWTSACAAAPAPTSATSSSAPAIRRTCRCCGPSCCARSTATTSPRRARSSARWPAARKLTVGRAQGVVLLLLPVHRVPPLLGLLPLRHRHRRDHDDRPRAAEPRRAQHQLDHGAGGQLLPHRQPPRHPAAHLQGQHRVPRATTSRRSPGSRSTRRSTARAPRSCSSSPRPTTSPTRASTPSWATCCCSTQIGLDYTLSAYASEGGNFGLFTSHEMIKRLNAKIYAEAKRLGVKWILGGECGHMWRVLHQYMDTMNGPADFLEVPVSPITGTRFENAASTKMVHICEFTADLIQHGKLQARPEPQRPLAGHLPRLLQPGPGHGPLRGAALRPQQRLQQLLRDAREHDPRADLLLRRRRRAGQRREHGDAAARRPAAGQRGASYVHEQARREHARLHLRHRPGRAAAR